MLRVGRSVHGHGASTVSVSGTHTQGKLRRAAWSDSTKERVVLGAAPSMCTVAAVLQCELYIPSRHHTTHT